MTEKPKSRKIKGLSIISLTLFIGAFCLIIYDALWGHFLFSKSYGPGAYYFTDVPGWQNIFLKDSPFLGFHHPILAALFFITWSVFMYKLLCYLNDKL